MSKYLALQFKNITTPGGYQPGTSIQESTGAVEKLLSNVLVILTIVASLAFAIMFLLGGLNWITAGGDKGKIEEARGKITQGLIGLALLAASYVIIKFIETAIGMNLLNISWPTAG